MPSPIIWQNEAKDVTLIDIPRSIECAQGTTEIRHLQSTSPLEVPFLSNEPKSASGKARLQQHDREDRLHEEYRSLLNAALEEIRGAFPKAWCLPRPFTNESTPHQSKKRKLTHDVDGFKTKVQPTQAIETGGRGALSDRSIQDHADDGEAVTSTGGYRTRVSFDAEERRVFSNTSDQPTTIYIPGNGDSEEHRHSFNIPPGSSFYLGDCADAKPLRDAVRDRARQADSTHLFNFILLDPPWPNSSVKRTHHTPSSTYATSPSLWDLREMLLDTKIELLMAEECLIGVWITNKPAVRELVLHDDGLFACWGVQLVEEWAWLKTTIHGEPVSPLDAVWRKPYEVLLLGRKRRKVAAPDDAEVKTSNVQRKVMLAVPDLHSRKPCLKELIEPMMPDPKRYRALEVFARYLVAGWWSWGNECIKFNWECYWQKECEKPEKLALANG
ncbi:uncharacterized protein LTR77_009074 [Saxophila tyrrhenica]|uniref:MT-A70-domain-containing protein n=1 Tax=Saxophila tyrrhenica TaxID=1690608 RepID=A0AAV9NZP9_9PEZI|nr:hypothetical protein LTR77_009074 [Saxophila tyrrhenica]